MDAMSDESGLRLAFAVAKRAIAHGNHPFGCVLLDPTGKVLLESENGYMPDRNMTARESGDPVLTAHELSRTPGLLDHPPGSVIGPAFGRTRWRMMTPLGVLRL